MLLFDIKTGRFVRETTADGTVACVGSRVYVRFGPWYAPMLGVIDGDTGAVLGAVRMTKRDRYFEKLADLVRPDVVWLGRINADENDTPLAAFDPQTLQPINRPVPWATDARAQFEALWRKRDE